MREKYTVKRHLAASLVALALCVAMLLGTTFAWFSDEAKTAANTVTAGNLHVALEYKTPGGDWADAEGADLFADSGADMSLWEPGMAVLSSAFRVRNTGTLALTYTLTATLEGESGLSEVIQMAVLGDGDLEAAGVADPRADTQRGPLAEYVEAREEGGFAPVGSFSQSGKLSAGESGATDPQYILLYWKPNADEVDNRYNGTADELSFHLDVRATQAPEESDSFGDGYDADASKPPVQKPATVGPKDGWPTSDAMKQTITDTVKRQYASFSYTSATKLVFSNWDKYKDEVGGSYDDGLTFGAVPTDNPESTDETGARIFYKETEKALYILTKDPNVKIKAPGTMEKICYTSSLKFADLSGLDTSEVQDFRSMCYSSYGLEEIILTGFDTSSATDMTEMFQDCKVLQNIDLGSFDTSNVTTMKGMFQNSAALTSVDLSSFNMSNITSVNNMFYECKALQSVDLHTLDLSKCEDFNSMFLNCSSLAEVNMSGMHFPAAKNIGNIFAGCSSLSSVDLTPFAGAKLTAINSAFSRCAGITSADLSMLDTTEVTDISSLFNECTSLTSINFGDSFTTENVTNMQKVFKGCTSLVEVDISTFNPKKADTAHGGSGTEEMFMDCSSLTTIYASEKFKIEDLDGDYNCADMFRGCVNIRGGSGTTYRANEYPNPSASRDSKYARIDGLDGMEGYFTRKQ